MRRLTMALKGPDGGIPTHTLHRRFLLELEQRTQQALRVALEDVVARLALRPLRPSRPPAARLSRSPANQKRARPCGLRLSVPRYPPWGPLAKVAATAAN